MMTKRGYIELAHDLKLERAELRLGSEDDVCRLGLKGFDAAVQTMCSVLKRDNPNFDKARFLAAAGLT